MKLSIQIILAVLIAILAFWVYNSIQQPIRFQEHYDIRQKAVIKRLSTIRSAQMAYLTVKGQYTGSFDTLVTFIKTEKIPLIKMEGSISDSLLEAGMTEVEALKKGIIKRDTFYVSVRDSLFKGWRNLDSLRYVPTVKDGSKFELAAGSIVTNAGLGVKVQVFECKVSNDVFLKGLDALEIGALNDKTIKIEKYPGLKVGSLTETNNNAGNWE